MLTEVKDKEQSRSHLKIANVYVSGGIFEATKKLCEQRRYTLDKRVDWANILQRAQVYQRVR
jgi:hypothetical protein